MINKEQFVRIINKLIISNDFVNEVNNKIKTLRTTLDPSFIDFYDGQSMFITHENIVIELLINMFDDKADIISWWIYDLDYGRKYVEGCISDSDGKNIDLSTAEKLYDYLIEEMEK